MWLTIEEIEQTVENELVTDELYPSVESPSVNIEAFLDRRAHLDQYAVLSNEVAGETHFTGERRPTVLISRSLTEGAHGERAAPPWVNALWRSTLAHEAAHVVFHQPLYDVDTRQSTFFDSDHFDCDAVESPRHTRCLRRNVEHGASSADPAEYQANRGMAALLMPRALFRAVFVIEASQLGVDAEGVVDSSEVALVLATAVAKRFDTSQQASAIRMRELALVRATNEPLLIGGPG